MGRSDRFRLGVVFTSLLFSCLFFTGVDIAGAGVAGSRHDFAGKNFAAGDRCSACHRVHGATDAARVLWSRSLAEEEIFFDQTNAPDYMAGSTLLCYDCHDNQSAGTVDDDPMDWNVSEEPMDIAFADGPPSQGGTATGYYEKYDGTIPADPGNPGPTDGSETGGHFWQTDPVGAPDYEIGDKLSCRICHDPHDAATGSNEAMFRTSTPDGVGGTISLGDGHTASGNSRDGTGTGRGMCASCHSYSDFGAPVDMWGVTLPEPPATVAAHGQGGTTPCTNCHAHNRVKISCDSCHGYPPVADMTGKGVPGNYEDAALEVNTNAGAGHDAPDHVAPDVVGGDGWAPCLKCHWNTDHPYRTVVSRANVEVVIRDTYYAKNGDAGTVVYNKHATSPSLSSCSDVSCHGGQETPVWTGAIDPDADCTVCHVREPDTVDTRAAAGEYQSAYTGMHSIGAGPTWSGTAVSDQDHWIDGGAACGGTSPCHTAQPLNHFGANLDDSALVELSDGNAGLRAGITIAPGPGHDPDGDTCAVACHAEAAAGAPYWARLNDKARAVATDGTECGSCHGTFDLGWVDNAGILDRPGMGGVGGPGAAVEAHDYNWDGDGTNGEVQGSHGTCKTCHGMSDLPVGARPGDADTNYDIVSLWDPTGVDGDHGNGRINMNGPSADDDGETAAGTEYNGNNDGSLETSDYSCTSACHLGPANADHNMGDSGWSILYEDYGAGGACEDCHDGSVSPAPNVMTYWTSGGHGDPSGRPASACTDCHDTSLPPGTHMVGGVVNSVWENGTVSTRNANTAHLKAEYFTKYPANGPGAWSVQVAVDNYCAEECHNNAGAGPRIVKDHRHERDTIISDANHWSVELGTHLTFADGDRAGAPYPIDCDLNTAADCSDTDYAPCISCHDPHGTGVNEPTEPSNYMLRELFKSEFTLCDGCHNG